MEMCEEKSPVNTVINTKKSQLSIGQKLSWGIGGTAETLMVNTIGQLALPIYNIALGVSPVLVSYALAIPRIWDAFTDPFMGNISDNTRSRWGRRRPYIFLGAILSGILFIFLWVPPISSGEIGLFVYFLILSIPFFAAVTVFIVPQNALGLELSMDYNERTKVMAYRAFFASAGGLLLPWAYKLSLYSKFGNNEVEGVRVVGIIFGGLMIITGVIPAIFCRERLAAQSQKKISLKKAFKYTIENKVFLLLAGAVFMVLLGLFMVAPFGLYINIYYIFGGDKSAAATIAGIGGTVYAAMSLAMIPVVAYIATHIGKKTTFIIGQCLIVLASLSSWFFYNPNYPYLQLVPLVIIAPGLSCVFVLSGSVLADICDIDELNSGLRREGMYGAIFSWVFKGGVAGAVVLSGYMVNWSGFDSKLEHLQSPETIFNMRFLYAIIPALCVSVSILLMGLFPITKRRVAEVRSILDSRKQNIHTKEGKVVNNDA
jgi:GPH family glycoside/pentoside/hexuronide:cation symporter